MIDRIDCDYLTLWPDVLHRGTPRDRTSAAAECAAEALDEVRLEQKRERNLLLTGAPAGLRPVAGVPTPARPSEAMP